MQPLSQLSTSRAVNSDATAVHKVGVSSGVNMELAGTPVRVPHPTPNTVKNCRVERVTQRRWLLPHRHERPLQATGRNLYLHVSIARAVISIVHGCLRGKREC